MIGFIRHPHLRQQCIGAGVGLCRMPAMNVPQRQGDVLSGRQMAVEIKLLKDKTDPAAQLAQRLAGELARGFPVNQDVAGGEIFQLVDQANQRRFTGTRRAENSDHLTGRHAEVDAFQHRAIAVAFHHFAKSDAGLLQM